MPRGGKEFCMLYVSAVFLFLFLPIMLAAYSVAPTKIRRYVLLSGGVIFYVLANFKTPMATLLLASVCVGSYFVGGYIHKTQNRAVLLGVIAFDILLLFVLRSIYGQAENFIFPLGAAIFLLSSISYCYDLCRGDAPAGSIIDCLLYMTFFPIMVIGPVVKYKDFRRYITDAEHNIENFTDGIRLFSVGFVKLVAVASVTLDAYKTISELGGDNLGFSGSALAMLLVVMTVFFALSGWSDMGCGLALMFGIRIPRDFDFSLMARTPGEFFASIFRGLSLWIDDYAISPIRRRFFRDHKKLFSAVSHGICVVFVIMWLRTTVVSTMAAVLAGIIVFAEEYFGLSTLVTSRKPMYPIGWLVSFLVAAFVCCAVTSEGIVSFGESLSRLGVVSSLDIYYVYNALSGFKYIFIVIAGILLGLLSHRRDAIIERLPKKGVLVYDAVGTAILMIMFVFTLLYFMPRYPQYASGVFEFFSF